MSWPTTFEALWSLSPLLAALYVADAFVVGACLGGFCATVGHRLRSGEHVRCGLVTAITRRARCSSCGSPLALRDNLPIVSWLFLRGRCRHCHSGIGVVAVLAEIIGAGALAAVALRYSLSWGALFGCFAVGACLWFVLAAPFLVFHRQGFAADDPTVRDSKLQLVRTANRAIAEEHAAKYRKALPLHDEIGPFPLCAYTDGRWVVRDVWLCATGSTNAAVLLRVRSSSRSGSSRDTQEFSPQIPNAPGGQVSADGVGWVYGPYDTLSLAYQALRVHMLRWALSSLLASLDQSGVSLAMLRVRLEEAVRDASSPKISNSLSLSVWINQLRGLLSLKGQGDVVGDGLVTLNRYLSAA